MNEPRILSVRRTDDAENSSILLRVSKNGTQELDLLLLGSEGNNAFVKTINQDTISSLRAKSYRGDDEEWRAALLSLLLHSPPDAKHTAFVENLEMTASYDEKAKHIGLQVRRRVSGITQRLGDIWLSQDDSYFNDVELWVWTGLAAEASWKAENRVMELQKKYDEQQSSVENLQAQLDEFITVKQQDEEQMLEKFRQLLNAKKLKIRDQQRLLAGAKVDPAAAAEVQKARSSTATRGSRAEKRKATEAKEFNMNTQAEEAGDDDTDMETASMTVETPERSSAEDEDEAADTEAPPPWDEADKRPSEPPPPRDLPFGKRPTGPAAASSSKMDVDEDEEETDDEL